MNYIPNICTAPKYSDGAFGTREHHIALLERQLGFSTHRQFCLQQQFSESLIHRLGLHHELAGHQGCVNCIEWNSDGTLLASGSDDCTVRIWNTVPSNSTASNPHVISTGHKGNIFGVKFLPESNDNVVISGAADGEVRMHDVSHKEILRVYSCHLSRVKRIATAPDSPCVFWSGAEDGLVLQYDTRVRAKCSDRLCNHILINLNPYLSPPAEVKSIVCNPVRTHYIALGATDCFVRLYDRRMLSVTSLSYPQEGANEEPRYVNYRQKYLANSSEVAEMFRLPQGCVQCFTPGHLPVRNAEMRSGWKSFAVTDVRFSADGSEILANIGSEQVYLFGINSTDTVSKVFSPRAAFETNLNSRNIMELDHLARTLKEEANAYYHKQEFDHAVQAYDRAICYCSCSSVLYSNRAVALLKRNWDGDSYQSLLDAYKAFLLDPSNDKAQFRVIKGLYHVKRYTEATAWLDFFRRTHGTEPRNLVDTDAFRSLENDVLAALDPQKPHRTRAQKPPVHFAKEEAELESAAIDYVKRFVGHCNTTTDIKEANFLGQTAQYIMAGSDDGSFFIWDRETTNLLKVIRGDHSIVNCLQAHPTTCQIATSGIDSEIRIWSPMPERDSDGNTNAIPAGSEDAVGMDVEDIGQATNANQRRMNADPWAVLFANWSQGAARVPQEGQDEEMPGLEGCAQQ